MSLRARLTALEKRFPPARPPSALSAYAARPGDYVREVLHQELWSVQTEIAEALLRPPYKVLVKSANKVGKSFLGGCLINWWYDTRTPSAVISTAPSHAHVCDVLWREVRLLRGNRGGFAGPSAPLLFSAPDHYAKGLTTNKPESFQGRHQERQLFVIDEAVGVDASVWTVIRSMFKPDGKHSWVCFFNPTDASSQACAEERAGGWTVITMSALAHPNIAAELAGLPAPYPSAVSLAQVQEWLREWAEPIEPGDATVTDLEFPPGSGKWIRPGPLCESRVLGRWPSQAAYSVWSDSLWQSVLARRIAIKPDWPVQIGADVARFGDDSSVFHVRKGLCSLHHEAHQGWSLDRTAGRLKQLAYQYQDAANPELTIPVLVDVGGMGAGVVDMAGRHSFVGIDSAAAGLQPERFLNLRSTLWFGAQECAKAGLMDVSRLDARSRQEIGRQLLAPVYTVDSAGRLVVEPKHETKKRLKASPDAADAVNLSYFSYVPPRETVAGQVR